MCTLDTVPVRRRGGLMCVDACLILVYLQTETVCVQSRRRVAMPQCVRLQCWSPRWPLGVSDFRRKVACALPEPVLVVPHPGTATWTTASLQSPLLPSAVWVWEASTPVQLHQCSTECANRVSETTFANVFILPYVTFFSFPGATGKRFNVEKRLIH